MVKIAPNWARLRGTVVGVQDTADPSGFLEVTVRVADIGSIPRTRNMFEQQPGEVVKVLIAPPLVARLDLRPGVELEADVRRADLHRSFAHPERIRVASAGDETPARDERRSVDGAPEGEPAGDPEQAGDRSSPPKPCGR
jgi:hypothetical protein